MSSSHGWRPRVMAREVACNLRAELPWHAVTGAVCIAVVLFVAYADATAIVEAVTTQRTLTTAGQYALVARNADPTGPPIVDTAACLRLAASPAAVAGGGLRLLGSGAIASHPGTPFRLYAGVGGIRRALDISDEQGGAAGVSSPLAHQLGVADAAPVRLSRLDGAARDDVLPSRWFSPGGRHEFGDIMWLVAQPVPSVDECWIELTPAAARSGGPIVRSALAFQPDVAVSNVVSEDDRGTPPLQRYEHRVIAGLYPYFGLFIALPVCLLMWSRRVKIALYRSVGAGRLRAAAMVYMENLWVVLFSATVGLLLAASRLAFDPRVMAAGVWLPVLHGFFIVVASSQVLVAFTAVVLARGNIAAQLKAHA